MALASADKFNRRSLLKWSARISTCLLLALLAAVALLYFRQHDMVYHPRPYPSDVSNRLPPGVLEVEYQTIACKQVAFFLPRGAGTGAPARLWVAFGGNGSLALEWLDFIQHDPNRADAFLLIEYPGYGKSDGYAAIATNRAAVDGALEALKKALGADGAEIESRLNAIGHSFGTAAALDFATHLRDLAAQTVRPRVAIFHGTSDDIIPFRMGRELALDQPNMIDFFPIEGGDHLSPLFKNADEIVKWMNQ